MDTRRIKVQNPLTCCGLLAAATLGLWLLLALPAWLIAGGLGLEGLTYSALLCLIPGLLVFACSLLFDDSDNQGLFVVMGGTVLRLLIVLFGVMALGSLRPDLRFREFIVWLVVFYLTTLLVETLLAVKRQTAAEGRARQTVSESTKRV